MEEEFYGDGQHNGGVYNSGNLNPYIYCYQSPIRYIDPNGKQVDTSGTIWDETDFYGDIHPATQEQWEKNPINGFFHNTFYIGSEMSGLNFIEDRIQNIEDGKYELPEPREILIETVTLVASKVKPIKTAGKGFFKWISKVFTPNYEKKGTKLAEKIRKLTQSGKANPTIFKDGKAKFRVHRQGEHGAPSNESYIDVFEEGVNPNNGRSFNIPKTQKFNKDTYRMLKKAVKQKDGFDARTKNGSIINTR